MEIRLIKLIAFLLPICFVAAHAGMAWADKSLPGYKAVTHELIFEASDELAKHRLVAAPVDGDGAIREVKSDERFRFSGKHETRFYLVPREVELTKFDSKQFQQWPSVRPPVNEVASVQVSSPVASALTTLKFSGIDDQGNPIVEVVDHIELDRRGKPADSRRSMMLFGLIIVVGLGFCLIAIRRMKKMQRDAERAFQAQVEAQTLESSENPKDEA